MIEFLTDDDRVIDVVAIQDGELTSGPLLRDVARSWLRQGKSPDAFDDAYASWTNGYNHSRRTLDDLNVLARLKPVSVGALVASDTFHLPGRHEQKNHGNRKGKKSAANNVGTSLDAIRSDYDARVTQAARDDDVFDATEIRDKRALYKRIRQNDDELGGVEGDVIRSSVNDYVNSGYTKYNTALRQGDTADVAEGVHALDAAINESPLNSDVIMWRGVLDPSVTFGSAWKPTGDNSGLTYVDRGYSSLSAYEEVANNFSTRYGMDTNGVKMRILVPKGKKLLGVEQNIDDEANSEGELLGQRGLKFRVVRDYSTPGPKQGTTVRTLDVEVID